jgi:hypothetical protein
MYDLYKLGWYGFQQLCHTVLRELLGQTVESFLDSNDGGRDGAFAGNWIPKGAESLHGKFVFQCKFTSKPGTNITPSGLKDEFVKVEKLVKENQCDSYILITNAGVSGTNSKKIEAKLNLLGVANVAIFSGSWISQQIIENKRLRMLVPRVYGLGDLSQILDERVYAQASALLCTLKEELAKVVVTGAYQKAVKALNEHSFVLLIGEPAAGKTTIASLLAVAALDNWQAYTMKLDDAGKVIQHWNPDDPKQFFWIDDAFGVTQYESSLAKSWNRVIPQLKTMIQRGAKIVMTSRDYIYNGARKDLKEGAFPILQESQVVIDVHNLTMDEKRQILYNHLKLGRQNKEFRHAIKPYLENICGLKRFIPETARRLADPAFTKNLLIDQYSLDKFVNNQHVFLQDMLKNLDDDSKAALSLIYMRNDNLKSPVVLTELERIAIERMKSTFGGCSQALKAMENSFVIYSAASDEPVWKFKHPTLSDAFATILSKDAELMEIYIVGTSVDKLLDQVTCGKVEIDRAVLVPKGLFSIFMEKLKTFSSTAKYKTESLSIWGAKYHLDRFLATRCSKDFLILYIDDDKGLMQRLSNPSRSLFIASEVDLALRLHELGLFTEEFRKRFIQVVSEYTISGNDLYIFDNSSLKKIFTSEEFKELLKNVKEKLIPVLSRIRIDRQDDYNQEGTPEDHMAIFLDSLRGIEKEFENDEYITEAISKQIREVNSWVSENEPTEEINTREKLGDVEVSTILDNSRSVFDDIDN